MFRLLLITFALAACGPPPEVKHQAPPTKPAPTSAPAKGATPVAVTASTVPEIGCLTTTCAYHAGAGAYFTCLAGGAGACFHFGAACAPADHCMFDPGDRTYKQCAAPVEGTCSKWGAACQPQSACMFDPADGLHHHCDEPAAGTCKKYGALCAP